MRRFIQIYFYHMECNKSATNRADFAAGMKKTAFLQIVQRKRLRRTAAKPEKWNLPLVEKQRIWYNILHDAPSPSGKAGDFDSLPIDGCIISDLYEAFKIIGDSMILKAFFFSEFNKKICCAGQKEIF